MSLISLRNLALAALGATALGGCASYGPYLGASVGVGSGYYDPYYGGYGYGYDRYSPNYGSYGGYGSYGRYGSPYGGYASPYGGWYSGYYYPGTGYYVYDSQRRRYPMSDAQRRYWQHQRAVRQANPTAQRNVRIYRQDDGARRPAYQVDRRENRGEVRRSQAARQDRREARKEQREDKREWRREQQEQRKPD